MEIFSRMILGSLINEVSCKFIANKGTNFESQHFYANFVLLTDSRFPSRFITCWYEDLAIKLWTICPGPDTAKTVYKNLEFWRSGYRCFLSDDYELKY